MWLKEYKKVYFELVECFCIHAKLPFFVRVYSLSVSLSLSLSLIFILIKHIHTKLRFLPQIFEQALPQTGVHHAHACAHLILQKGLQIDLKILLPLTLIHRRRRPQASDSSSRVHATSKKTIRKVSFILKWGRKSVSVKINLQ